MSSDTILLVPLAARYRYVLGELIAGNSFSRARLRKWLCEVDTTIARVDRLPAEPPRCSPHNDMRI